MATQGTSTGHIFLSYAREDQAYARKLAADLRAHGFEVWMDDSIGVGDRYLRTIAQAIRTSAALVVVMTPAAEQSEWVEDEILQAKNEKKPIFPLLLREPGVSYLSAVQYADVTSGQMPPDQFYERLAQVVPSKSKAEQQPHIRKLQGAPLPLFEDDFQHGLDAWTIRNGQLPQTDRRGLRLTNFDNELSKMVILKDHVFADGVIECEVNLDQGALFDVAFWADLGDNPPESDEFYLARFDTRTNNPKARDGILFKAAGKGQWWNFCHEHTKNNSPSGQWLTMRIEASGSHIALFCQGQLIDQITDAVQVVGSIALLAEIEDVHVKKISIKPR
jgi:hypothetical protein